MIHDVGIIATLAIGFGLALVFGYIAVRLKIPPLVAYICAGIVIGPFTPGFVGDANVINQLAEVGVMLLMFGVGLHFSLGNLLSVKKIAIPGAIVQIVAAVSLSAWVALGWGWSVPESLVFGLCLSVASTVVLLRMLESKNLIDTINGHIAVGWLIVEDLVMIFVLVMLPSVSVILSEQAVSNNLYLDLGFALVKVFAFIAVMIVVGRTVFPRVLALVAKTGSRELFTLCTISTAVGVAFGAAKLFDVSFALGAFFAGMMLRESEHSHRVANESLPLRDAFSVLFFISVGMLFNPSIILSEPIKLLVTLSIILVGKTLVAILLVLAFRYPMKTAFIVGISLAQIGEFSFILASLGVSLSLISNQTYQLILGAAIISIVLNSFLFLGVHKNPAAISA